ncbi:hypothetical protein [Lysobacter sp. FW306-1B-D06B]|uniref:hypothetical protein n=1 Tax=Lysobacter sp. FW306-1B-D06B TaxID=3140250 RepID=UPI00314036F0
MTTKKKPPRRKPANPPRKAGAGRPTKYQPTYADQARKLALLGMTDKEMGDFFGVAESTLHLWKKEHPEFSESLKAGKNGADIGVATSLYHSALGGGTVTEVKEEMDAEGNVITKKTVKQLAANVTAQIFWLKNRQPLKWRDKVVLEDETPAETLTATADKFFVLMAAARERQQAVLTERGLLDPRDEN